MRVSDLLDRSEVERYHQEWKDFSGKDRLAEQYHVHSSKPVISEVFLFRKEPMPILRAKVFRHPLREFDPYFVMKKYGNPFWHLMHYFTVLEQMYHAGSNMIRDNSRLCGKDVLGETNFKRPIFWENRGDRDVSVEMIIEPKENDKPKLLFQETGHFTYYNDKRNGRLSYIELKTFWNKRSHVRDYEEMQGMAEGDPDEARERLVRKIQMQSVKHEQWSVHPRGDLSITSEELIERVRGGSVTEEELHDYFSHWNLPVNGASEDGELKGVI